MTDAEVDPLLDLFRSEVGEQTAELSRGLLELGSNPASGRPLDELIAAAHTIRGAARIIKLDAAARLADSLEAMFAEAKAGQRKLTPADVESAQQITDSLAALSETEPVEWAQASAFVPFSPGGRGAGGEGESTGRADSPSPSPQPPPARGEKVLPLVALPTIDPSLLELFREEARGHAAALSAGLLDLERNPGDARLIEPLMRAAHSLKGAARIVGLDPAVKLAHEMEDAFVAAGAGKLALGAPEIDLLLRGADVLAALGTDDLSQWVSHRHAEVEGIRAAVAGVLRGEAPAPAAKPAEPPPAPVPAAEPVEAVVRVTAGSLNRLMSLAGESLVQARWLPPFAASLARLKKHQDELTERLDALAHRVPTGDAAEVLADARRQAARCRQALAERAGEFEGHAAAAEDLNTRLYREVIVSRMRPFSDGAGGFPRLVRDTARSLGKSARLDVIGPSTEVDRDILEKLEAPLTHLLRNAVDHGLELPEARAAAGKPAEGVIRVEVRHRAGMLSITVADDGAGIDVERIRKAVVERRHATAEMAGRMSETELLEFLFLPGFTTTSKVTEVSGRGVGLDVVRETVARVGGTVHVTTKPGKGTAFHLLLPITLSVVRAVLAEIAGEPYAFPHNRIDRLLRVPRTEVRSLENRQFITVDGRNVALVLAAQLLDLPAEPPAADELLVVLLSDAAGAYGLIVEAFRGEQDLVVRPLDARLGKVANVSAAAILDDGSPVLIADAEDLIRSMDQFIRGGTLRRLDRETAPAAARKRVLVVDDSITVREVQRQVLKSNGYDVEVAVDGQDGWNRVRAGKFDLVISDVDMPRLGGLDFVRRIRDDDALRDVPVIIVSYKDRDEDRLKGLDAGANAYLTKSSFHDDTFLEAVAGLIGRA